MHYGKSAANRFRSSRVVIVPILVAATLCLFGAAPSRAAEKGDLEKSSHVIETKSLAVSINDQGQIVGLKDKLSNRNYLLANPVSYLLSLKKFNAKERVGPSGISLKTDAGKSKTFALNYPENLTAEIKVKFHPEYLSLELVSVSPENTVEFAYWGPYYSTIDETVGSSVGVVRNGEYALGIQLLTLKTVDDSVEWSGRNRFGTLAESMLRASRRGQEQVKKGSRLQAHSQDRTIAGVRTTNSHPNIRRVAIDGETVVGSKIALFGCPVKQVLKVISDIEVKEGLPHPMINGQWVKTSPLSNSSKFITNFTEANLDECIAMAKKAGIHCLYSGRIWKSWGHFEIDEKVFPDGLAGVRRCVEKAAREGIDLGAHTLSSFIQPRDPYVTPAPHSHLAFLGITKLAQDVGESDTVLRLADDTRAEDYHGKDGKHARLKAVRVGNELIQYASISGSKPHTLTGCKRGAFGTHSGPHEKGAAVAKLVSHPYKVFFPDVKLIPEMARNLAMTVNRTGLKRIGLDGLEDNHAGHGRYAQELFAKTFYDNLKDKGVHITGSDLPPFFWHICTTISWGEPWGSDFRAGMQAYRFEKLEYLAANYMPRKMGQYRFTSIKKIEDVEWLLARSAGWDAGFDLYVHPTQLKRNSSLSKDVLATIKLWEDARAAGAFSSAQKKALRDPQRAFKLKKQPDGSWQLTEIRQSKKTNETD